MNSEKKSSSAGNTDLVGEMFVSWLLLVISGVVIGRFICAPLGNILMVTCGVYTVFLFLFLFFGLFISTFSRIDEEKMNRRPKKSEGDSKEISAHGYIIYSTIAYILLWILMFIIFPEGTETGEFIRQWG